MFSNIKKLLLFFFAFSGLSFLAGAPSHAFHLIENGNPHSIRVDCPTHEDWYDFENDACSLRHDNNDFVANVCTLLNVPNQPGYPAVRKDKDLVYVGCNWNNDHAQISVVFPESIAVDLCTDVAEIDVGNPPTPNPYPNYFSYYKHAQHVVSINYSKPDAYDPEEYYWDYNLWCFYDWYRATLSPPPPPPPSPPPPPQLNSPPLVVAVDKGTSSSVDFSNFTAADELNVDVDVSLDKNIDNSLFVDVPTSDFQSALESLASLANTFPSVNVSDIAPSSVFVNSPLVHSPNISRYDAGAQAFSDAISDLNTSLSTLSIGTGAGRSSFTVAVNQPAPNLDLDNFCDDSNEDFFVCSTLALPGENFFDVSAAVSATSGASGGVISTFFGDGVSTAPSGVRQTFGDNLTSPITTNASEFVNRLGFGSTPVPACRNPVVNLRLISPRFAPLVLNFCPFLDAHAGYIRWVFGVSVSIVAIYIVFVGRVPGVRRRRRENSNPPDQSE